MSMTLATAWVRRGVAAQFPTKYDVDEAELSRISKLARLQLNDAQEDLDQARSPETLDEDHEDEKEAKSANRGVGIILNGTSSANGTEENDLQEYNLDEYDSDPIDDSGEKFTMFGNVKSLAYHAPDEEDPYITLADGDPESDDEREELQILPNDNLILAAKVEDEVANLEIYVYEDESDNMYVHHDIMLPAVPLCVEWIDVPVGKDVDQRDNGNFVAVGTMRPEIEIWDLDVVDSMYPNAILGTEIELDVKGSVINGESTSKKKKSKKSKKRPKSNDEFHVDAVLALAANRQHRNLLASASADKTVKLWDLNSGKCAKSYKMHSGKVCALDWHPQESTVLLSGSYDRTVVATDMQAPDAPAPKWIVEADVEKVRWDVHDSNFFYVSTEIGTVHYFDARQVPSSHEKPSKPVWTLHAHDGAVSAFDINPTVQGFLVTGSDDKSVKLWNVRDNKPSLVVSRNFQVGRIFATQFAPDAEIAFRLSIAGSSGQLQIWDTSTNPSVRSAFVGDTDTTQNASKDRVIKIIEKDDEEKTDEEDAAEIDDSGAGADGWESMEED